MACSVEYRDLAAQQRSEAEAAQLPQVRSRHLDAAKRWEILAEELERFEVPVQAHQLQQIFY